MKSDLNIKNNLDIAACVLFYNKLDRTIECIKSLLPSGVKIYVLNNNSLEKLRKNLGKFAKNYKQIKIFDSKVNLGPGVGRNYIINNTKEKWLFFLDNDIYIKNNDWKELISNHIENKDAEIFIPRLFNKLDGKYKKHNIIIIKDDKVRFERVHLGLTNTYPAGAAFINRKVFNRLGLYDEKIFIGFEEYEFSIRGILSGKPIKAQLIDDIELIHVHKKPKKGEEFVIKERYDNKILEDSVKRIYEKHGVRINSGWKVWTREYQERLLNMKK